MDLLSIKTEILDDISASSLWYCKLLNKGSLSEELEAGKNTVSLLSFRCMVSRVVDRNPVLADGVGVQACNLRNHEAEIGRS